MQNVFYTIYWMKRDSRKERRVSYSQLMKKHYPTITRSKPVLSRTFRIPIPKLDTVFDRGLRAGYASSGGRGGNPWQWGWARLYKFLLIDAGKLKPKANDPDLSLHKKRVRDLLHIKKRSRKGRAGYS